MLKLNKNANKEEWFDYDEDVAFLIRPFPLSERALTPSGTGVIDVFIKQAMYCLMDWKGVVDENEKTIKCVDENKQFLFDFDEDLVLFVCTKSKELNDKLVDVTSKKT